MKKLLIACLMLIATSTAFAGNSDALKAILKANTYTEAEQLVSSSLDQLAGNEEKATAYNKVVDLAMAKFNEERNKQLVKQPVDEEAMYNALDAAFAAADECYKYDQLPNAKGKVKPKYSKVNSVRLYQVRPYLINGGGVFMDKKDNQKAFHLLSSYITVNDSPLFAELRTAPEADPNYTNAAFFAGYTAFLANDYANAEKFSEIAINDSVNGENALNILLNSMKAQLHTAADSAQFMEKCKALYDRNPNSQQIFANLVDAYTQAGKQAEAEQLVNDRLAKSPNDFIALYVKGQLLELQQNYVEAADVLKKALDAAPEQSKLMLNASIGDCYFYHTQARLEKIKGALSKAAKDQFIPVYQNAIKYYEAAKALDVDQSQKSKYAARLYSALYFVYGEADARTAEAKAYAGY